MFTAKFKSEAENEQQFKINRPRAEADTSKLPEHDLAIIKVAIDEKNPTDTSYYFGWTNKQDPDSIRKSISDIPDYVRQALATSSLIKVDTIAMSKLVRASKAVNNKLIFTVDADKDISFRYISKIMDILNKNNQRVFDFVTEKRKD
jgi:biopolymer transport protein ExbD